MKRIKYSTLANDHVFNIRELEYTFRNSYRWVHEFNNKTKVHDPLNFKEKISNIILLLSHII